MAQASETVYVPCGTATDPADQEWAITLVRQVGISRAAKMIGVSRPALANVVAGLPCHRGTQMIVRAAREAELVAGGV